MFREEGREGMEEGERKVKEKRIGRRKEEGRRDGEAKREEGKGKGIWKNG